MPYLPYTEFYGGTIILPYLINKQKGWIEFFLYYTKRWKQGGVKVFV